MSAEAPGAWWPTLRVLLANAGAVVVAFLWWAWMDYRFVADDRAVSQVESTGWLVAVCALGPGITAWLAWRHGAGWLRAALQAVVAVVADAFLLIALVLKFGIPLHLSWGGSL